MPCKLFILEEAEEIEMHVGTITNNFLRKTINNAEKFHLFFLSFIDMTDDTIFNVEQLKEIKKELLILENKYEAVDRKDLEMFFAAVNSTIKEGQSTYLRISCDGD